MSKKITFNRKEFYDLIWSEPLSKLSKKYQISDNGLRKKCRKHEIPIPPNGYWGKSEYRREKIVLSTKSDKNDDIILYLRREDGAYVTPEESPLKKKIKELEQDNRLNFEVPKRLTNPHPLIAQARESLNENNVRVGRINGVVETHFGIRFSISPGNVPRALRLMDTFVKMVEARGHKFSGEHLHINEIDIRIRFRERLKRVYSEDKWRGGDYQPTGILAFRRGENYHYHEWTDEKEPLENKMLLILAKLEVYAQKEKEIRDYHEEQNRIRKEKERKEKEKIQQINDELESFKELLSEANRWHQSNIIREYAKYLENKNMDNNQRFEVNWIKAKADWYDPTINKVDRIVGPYSPKYKDKLRF